MNGPRDSTSAKSFQLLRIGSSTRARAVVQPSRFSGSTQIRQVEVEFLKFHSAIILQCNCLPHHATIIRPPAATSDSVVHLELREHLRITPDAGRLELVPFGLSSDSFIRLLTSNLS